MKIKELIKKLQPYPEDMEVTIRVCDPVRNVKEGVTVFNSKERKIGFILPWVKNEKVLAIETESWLEEDLKDD